MKRLGVGLLLAVLTGCGGPPAATVEGVVTLGDRPLADVEVQFIPDPAGGPTAPPASAYTGKDGRYRIAVTDGTGGVPVGRHRVCVNDATLMVPGGGADPDSGVPNPAGGKAGPRRSRVPAAYSDAARTPFAAVEVRPGTQTLNFALQPNP